MKKTILIIIVFIIQISIPLSIIFEKEDIIKNGIELKFHITPIDPYDAFRGKYLIINVDNSIYPDKIKYNSSYYFKNQIVYVTIIKDKNGFNKFNEILLNKPADKLYLKTRIKYIYYKYTTATIKNREIRYITIDIPFNRFYINEKYAKAGEELYNKYSRGKKEYAHITVKLKDGKAVLEKLFFKNIEANIFIKAELEKNERNNKKEGKK